MSDNLSLTLFGLTLVGLVATIALALIAEHIANENDEVI